MSRKNENQEKIKGKKEIKYLNNLPITNTDKKYMEQLEYFINDTECKVIGVLGDYGSGKSSILNGLDNNKYNKIELSLINIDFSSNTTDKKQNDDDTRKDMHTNSDTTNDIRKNLTLQLINHVDENDIYIQKIKGKLLKHYNYKYSKGDKIIIILFCILLLLKIIDYYNLVTEFNSLNIINIHFSPLIKYIKILIDPLLIIFSILFIFYVVFKRIDFGFSEFKFDKFYFKKKEHESYLDYNLETIHSIIEYILEKSQKKTIFIFEDLDRYNNLKILQELHHICKSCSVHTKFVFALSNDIFKSPEESSKYFDATVDILPVTNNEVLYAHVQQYLDSEKITPELVTLLTPEIENIRVFNSIYNKYQLLKNNFEVLEPNLSTKDMDNIFILSFLQINYSKFIKNNTNSKNEFKNFIMKIYNKKEYIKLINGKCNNKVLEIKNEISSLSKDVDELLLIEKIDNENYLKAVRLDLYLKYKNRQLISKINNKKYVINEIFEKFTCTEEELIMLANEFLGNNSNSNKYSSKQEVIKLKNNITSLTEEKKFYEDNIMSVENAVYEKQYIDLINQYDSIDINIKTICADFASILKEECKDENNIQRLSNLLYSLVRNNFLTDDCMKYLTYNVNDSTSIKNMQRNFIYNYKSAKLIDRNDKDYVSSFLTIEFLSRFPTSEFKNQNFSNLQVLKVLSTNLEYINNTSRLREVIKNYNIYSYNLYNYNIDNYEYFKDDQKNANKVNKSDFYKLFDFLLKYFFKQQEGEINICDIKAIKKYYVDSVEEKNESLDNNDEYHMLLNKIADATLCKIDIDSINTIYTYDIEISIFMIELLYVYYVNNYEKESKLRRELFFILEYNLNNEGVNKNCKLEFIKLFKGEFKNTNKELTHKINDLVTFRNSTEQVDGYVKPYKVYSDNIFEYNDKNVVYMIKDEEGTFKNIKSSIKFLDYINESDKIFNLDSDKLNKMMDSSISGSDSESKIKLMELILLKYKCKFEDIDKINNHYQEYSINNKLFKLNSTNFNYLLENKYMNVIFKNYDFNESFINKSDVIKVLDYISIDDSISIPNVSIKNTIKRNLIDNKDKYIELVIDSLLNDDEKFDYLLEYLRDVDIDKDNEVLFTSFLDILRNKTNDTKSLEKMIINNIDIIKPDNSYTNYSNVFIIVNKDIKQDELFEFEKNIENSDDFRQLLLDKSSDKFMTLYYPTFEEYNKFDAIKDIIKEYNFEDKVNHIVNMRDIKDNVEKVLIDIDLYKTFDFPRSRSRSHKKNCIDRSIYTDEFLEILKEDNIISKYTDDKIYK